jgi:hypothetical protein
MVREQSATHINFLMKLYAEKFGYKGIKIDTKYSNLEDGVIHFTHEVSLSETDDKFKEFEKVLGEI